MHSALVRRGALAGLLYLFGGVAVSTVGVAILSMHVPDSNLRPLLFIAVIVAGTAAGGAAFARAMGRLVGFTELRRPGWSGSSFGLLVITAALVLSGPEAVALSGVEQPWGLPVHILFGVVFVPAVFCVVFLFGLAVSAALRLGVAAVVVAWKMAAAGSGAFLAATIIQDLLGRRVGGPNAEVTFTMLSVMLIGLLAAAVASGAVMASLLGLQLRKDLWR